MIISYSFISLEEGRCIANILSVIQSELSPKIGFLLGFSLKLSFLHFLPPQKAQINLLFLVNSPYSKQVDLAKLILIYEFLANFLLLILFNKINIQTIPRAI